MGEVIEEHDLARHIRYQHTIATGGWSSAGQSLDGRRHATRDTGEPSRSPRASSGCARATTGTPRATARVARHGPLRGLDHPSAELGRTTSTTPARSVVVIGSGATAATLIPAMAADVEHVTMLQRSPTYFRSGRNVNELADTLRRGRHRREMDPRDRAAQDAVRSTLFTRRCFGEPEVVHAGTARGRARRICGHRLPRRASSSRRGTCRGGSGSRSCRTAICSRRSTAGRRPSSPTRSSTFTETGLELKSGDATRCRHHRHRHRLRSQRARRHRLHDRRPAARLPDTVTYLGMMFTGIPNMVWVFGYFRASWTLRADLIADFVCRLLAHMEEKGAEVVGRAAP